jgi:uncharacterized protein
MKYNPSINLNQVRVLNSLGVVLLLSISLGCDPDQGAKGGSARPKDPQAKSKGSETESKSDESSELPRFVSMGTAPSGGNFFVIGNAISSAVNENKGDAKWSIQANGTKGTQENILKLEQGEFLLGMSNAAISYNAALGKGIWKQPYDIRSVVTMAPNVGLFVTKKESGIRTFSDLKGKRIAVGPAGAGFETFLGPLMTAHGISYSDEKKDFTPVPADYNTAVQLLGDGDIDAAFMGGSIPMPAIIQATSSMELHFIPFDQMAVKKLIDQFPFFQAATIPAKNDKGEPTYKGLEQDFSALNVGSMQLITHAKVNEQWVYTLTKAIWESRDRITAQTPIGKSINEKNAARNVGIEFHPGAIKFYKEIGIWKEGE